MGWTKRQFIEAAFEEIGYSSYLYDIDTDQLQLAARRLDSLMATYNTKGIRIGYNMSSDPNNIDLDADTNVPDSANEAIFLNLAIRVAPTVGKTVSVETKTSARTAYLTLLSNFMEHGEKQFQENTPAGAGNKPWIRRDPFLPDPKNKITVGKDSTLDFN